MIQGCGHVLCFLDMVGRRRRWSERDGFAGQEILRYYDTHKKFLPFSFFSQRWSISCCSGAIFTTIAIFISCSKSASAHPAKHCGGERKLPNNWLPAKTFRPFYGSKGGIIFGQGYRAIALCQKGPACFLTIFFLLYSSWLIGTKSRLSPIGR